MQAPEHAVRASLHQEDFDSGYGVADEHDCGGGTHNGARGRGGGFLGHREKLAQLSGLPIRQIPVVVPEPSTALLMLGGLAVLARKPRS
jgi:hypothetical protein